MGSGGGWYHNIPAFSPKSAGITIKKLWSAQEFGLEICSGVITRKNKARVVLLAYDTPNFLTDLIYVPTYYYQISQTVWEL